MKLQNLSTRTFVRLIVEGASLTTILLLFLLYVFTKDIRVILGGFSVMILLFFWGVIFLHYFQKKLSVFTDAIKVLVGKYEDANKEYQTQLLNAIKIPLMVYSGRIIQNYPLGLGIRAVIKTNQLVFEAASKSGSDVYNILSTGQLNGLSIALLLSIKNVYGDTKGLDILLIDDPLQTIDDISAISLADLLTQQGIGQIVLSTHEEAKAALLRYKFKHAGMSVREQNMQALYMKTVTEE